MDVHTDCEYTTSHSRLEKLVFSPCHPSFNLPFCLPDAVFSLFLTCMLLFLTDFALVRAGDVDYVTEHVSGRPTRTMTISSPDMSQIEVKQ
jgi:hypothetical protein